MVASDPLLQLIAAGLVLVLLPSAVILIRPVPRDRLIGALVVAAVAGGAVLGWDAALTLRADPPAALLDAAAAAAVTAVVTMLSTPRRGSASAAVPALFVAVQAGVWGALVLGLVLAATVGAVPSLLQRALGAVDATGVLALFTAPAAALLVFSLLPAPTRPVARQDGSPGTPDRSASRSGVRPALAVVMLMVAAAAWMVGVERVLSEATGRLAVNAVAGMLLGVLSWLVVSSIVGRSRPRGGVVVGAVLGWAAVGAGGAFLAPLALSAAAVAGAAAGAAIALRAPAGSSRRRRALVAVIVSTSIGGLIATVLADGFGLAASGATLGLLTQLVAVAVVVLISGLAALAAWSVAWILEIVARGVVRRRS